MKTKNDSENSIKRRDFIGGVATAAIGLTVVPRHVLGGNGFIAPSDKINVAYIGTGTQGLSEMPNLLKVEEAQVVAVCDPQKEARGYFDWSPQGLSNKLRETIGNKNWKPGGDNKIPGGRDCGQQIVEGYYTKHTGKNYKCAAYSDFREMFEKEKGIDAVKIMATDHLHGVMAAAAMKRGIHMTMHKPIANRLEEGFQVVEMAKKSDLITHLIPWESNGSMEQVLAWIKGGVIGKLKEVHNWSNRPVWPQYAELPTDKPDLPKGFDWDLWIGPETVRPYHPHYTNMVFRGWYDFGGGAMADMGHYSLWTVFEGLELVNPLYIEPNRSHVCGLKDDASAYRIENNFSFPFAGSVRFKYPKNSWRDEVELIWSDGGIRPTVPAEFYDNNKELPIEGLMFKGESGIIMSSQFTLKDPYVLSGDLKLAKELKKEVSYDRGSGIEKFIQAVKNNQQVDGSFRKAWPITEAVNLYAAALRSGKNLKYDAGKREITNLPDVNKYLKREYRKGWSLEEI
ncbi:MAG: Gfo/Idh/MocA family oxidoreductase [Bacteroidales bacterium]|nr:Gfo/Idh/MocA family oxidoreductase [Bacteroidales bacterium]